MTTACMGGWCSKRVGCPNYEVAGKARECEPAERLCIKGADGVRITHAHVRSEQAAALGERLEANIAPGSRHEGAADSDPDEFVHRLLSAATAPSLRNLGPASVWDIAR
jgi:hypothetical protein